MEFIHDSNYLEALLMIHIVAGWLVMVKYDCEQNSEFVALHDMPLYTFLFIIPMVAMIVSLIINVFQVGFISSICYVIVLGIAQIINRNILYYLYRLLFGRTGLGTLIPVLAIVPLIIYLFYVQLG